MNENIFSDIENYLKDTTKILKRENNLLLLNFNEKLEIEFKNFPNSIVPDDIFFTIKKQDKLFRNRKKDSKLKYITFNNWEIISDNVEMCMFFYDTKYFSLLGSMKANKVCHLYTDMKNIKYVLKETLLALEDWSINCPVFQKNNRI